MSIAEKLVAIAEKLQEIYSLKDKKPYINSSEITDFRYFNQEGKRNDVINKLDTSNGTNFYNYCYNAKELVEVDNDFSKSTQMYGAFNGCSNLVTVVYADFSSVSGATNLNTIFNNCAALNNITFAPESIRVNLSISASPLLSDASIQSIVEGLRNTTSARTLTLHADVKAKLTDAQKETIATKGWTLA